MTALATIVAPDTMGAIDLAADLAAAADMLEDAILDADWRRECWDARIARQREAYWDRLDRERAL